MTKEEIDKFFNTVVYGLIAAEKLDYAPNRPPYDYAMDVLHDVWALALLGAEIDK